MSKTILAACRLLGGYLVAALLLASLPVQGQWIRQTTTMTDHNAIIADLDVVSSNVVWVVGADGYDARRDFVKFARTTNGGTTWTNGSINASSAVFKYLTGVSAIDADNAWVTAVTRQPGVRPSRVYRTSNGGASWVEQSTAAFAIPDGQPKGIHMLSATTGVVVGDPNGGSFEVYTTTTGGTTWLRVPAANLPAPLTTETVMQGTLEAIGNNLWVGTSAGRVLRSTDAGLTWTASVTTLPRVPVLAFADAQNGLTLLPDLTGSAAVSRTTDGGQTWTAVAASGPCFGTGLSAVPGTPGAFVSTGQDDITFNSGVTGGSSYTLDYGLTWRAIDAQGHGPVSFLDASTGWSGGRVVNDFVPAPIGGMWKGQLPTVAPFAPCVTGLGGGSTCPVTTLRINGTAFNATPATCAGTPANNYTAYPATGSNTATLTRGRVYQLQVQVATSSEVAIWLDLNHDGVFASAEYFGPGRVTAGQLTSTPLNIPLLALDGPTLMRVRTRAAGTSFFATDACTPQTSGETRDYTLNLTGPGVGSVAPDWVRVQQAGGSASGTSFGESDKGYQAVVDDAGNLYVAGSFTGSTTFGGATPVSSTGLSDAFLAKYDATGTLLWVKHAGNNSTTIGSGLALDGAGGVYWAGSYRSALSVGGSPLEIEGQFLPVNPGGSSLFVARFTAQGTMMWARNGGGTGSQRVSGVAVGPDGSVFVHGEYAGGTPTFGSTSLPAAPTVASSSLLVRYNAQGAVLWAQRPATAVVSGGIAVDANGNSIAVGYDSNLNQAFVYSYDAGGSQRWFKLSSTPGGGSSGQAYGVALDALGNAYVTGRVTGYTFVFDGLSCGRSGASDGFLLKVSNTGTGQWLVPFRATSEGQGTNVVVDATDRVYVTGYYSGQLGLGADVLLNSTPALQHAFMGCFAAADGNSLWARGADGNYSRGLGIAVDAGRNVYFTGVFSSTVSFGPFSRTSSGDYDLFITKLGADCTLPTASAGPARVQVCGGGSVGLGQPAQAGVSYQWSVSPALPGFASSAAQPTAILPTATTPTTYVFSLQATANGCTRYSQAVVTVEPLPAAPTTTPATRCGAGQVTLAASGAPSGGSYRWYTTDTGGTPLSGVSSGSFLTPALSASTTYYVSSVSSTGCESARTAVAATVAAPPVAAISAGGALTFCPGGSVTLTATGGGTSTQYQWLRGGTPLTGATGSSYVATQAGTYTVTLTNSGLDCASTSAAVTVVVSPAAAAQAGASRAVCANVPTQLGAVSVAGYNYQWSPATGLSSATAANPTATLPNTGTTPITQTYTLTATTAAGCQASATVTVTVQPAPAQPVVTPQYQGAVTVLSSSSPTGNQWLLNGNPIPGATGPTYTVSSTAQYGSYTVVVTSANGCVSPPSAPLVVTDAAAAKLSALVAVYPNPSRDGQVTITLPAQPSGAELVLLNSLGQLIKRMDVPANRTAPLRLQWSGLARGVYSLRVHAGDAVAVKRLVIE